MYTHITYIYNSYYIYNIHIFLENNFSYLHPNALYQPSALRPMDILREYSFIISNVTILFLPLVLLAFVLLKKKKRERKKLFFTLP